MLQDIARPTFFPALLLQEDAGLPSNCFNVSFNGKLSTGFHLELNHPMGEAVHFTGTRFTSRMAGVRGCLYEKRGHIGYVRRAAVERVGRKTDIPVLVRPLAADKSVLLQIAVGYPVGSVSQVKIKFWAGVVTDGSIVQNSTGKEALVCLPHDGHVDVFTEDGLVRRVVVENGLPRVQQFDLLDQGERRIAQTMEMVNAIKLVNDEAIRLNDALYHQLVSMLEIKSVQTSTLFQQVFDQLEQATKARKLNKGVRAHMLEALAGFPFEHDYFRDNYCTDLVSGGTQMQFGSAATSKGVPAERRSQLAARRLRDQERGRSTKGASGGSAGKKQAGKKQ